MSTQTSAKERLPQIGESRFWNAVCHDVLGPRQGGAKIIVDAEDAALGCGKTSAATSLARTLADAFGYELKRDDMTLSAAEYLQRWHDHPGKEQPSVLVLDEAVGGGAGDARRSMSNSNLDLASAWQTMRVKRVVTIVTLAHWGDLDKRLKRLADYRLYCKRQPMGKYRPYRIKVGFDDGQPRTQKLDGAIHFPDMAGDPFYEALNEKKDELLDADTWDADDLVEDDEPEEDAEPEGPTVSDIVEEVLDGDPEKYVSQHPVNNRRYVDSDLLYEDFDLSHSETKRAKKQIQREVEL